MTMRCKPTNCFQESKFNKVRTKIDKKHPFCVVKAIINRHGENIHFELSEYIYIKQSLEDNRHTFIIKGKDMKKNRIENIISQLPNDTELALHSRVMTSKGIIYHIPMIDFDGELETNSIQLMKELIPNKIFKQFLFFKSGTSYHVYSTELITSKEWVEFMGRILLLNLPNKKPIVDSRWIGHRLLSGYSSLRWSCNTNRHKIIPTLVNHFYNN